MAQLCLLKRQWIFLKKIGTSQDLLVWLCLLDLETSDKQSLKKPHLNAFAPLPSTGCNRVCK
jgi:hypothetical protein